MAELLIIKTRDRNGQGEGWGHGGVHLQYGMLIQGSRRSLGTSGSPAGPRDADWETAEVLDFRFRFPWASNISHLSSTHNVQDLCQKLPM